MEAAAAATAAAVAEAAVVVEAEGVEAVARVIDAWLAQGSVAIQDDFPYWRGRAEACDAGKLLLLSREREGLGPGKCATLFFDDNIERGRAHIVDVRYSDTFESVPFSTSRGRYLIRATPLDAIADVHTFVRQVDDALAFRGAVAAASTEGSG